MLKKVLAVLTVFIFFAFSGLFVFVSPSSPVVFLSGNSDSTGSEKKVKINQLWSGIRDEIKNPKLYFLTKILIELPPYLGIGGVFDLGPLYKAAKNELDVSGSKLTTEDAKKTLLRLVDAGLDSRKVNDVLYEEKEFGFATILSDLWSLPFIKVLAKPKYAHLDKTEITIKTTIENNEWILYEGSLEPLFNAARNQGNKKPWYELSTSAKNTLIRLSDFSSFSMDRYLNSALAKTALDLLWSEIKSKLKTKYAYLSKTLIKIDGKDYNLEPLFIAAKDDTQYEKKGSALPASEKNKLQKLVNASITAQKFKVALDAKNRPKLNNLWSGIKSELKKPNYAHLAKTPILINGNNYNLEPLLAAAKDDTQYEKKGSQLPALAKNNLQSLVSASIDHQTFKIALPKTALDLLWSEIKSELKKPEYAYLSKTPIIIEGKEYKLELLFTAAKDDTQYRKEGSQLLDPAKDKLQELVNASITAQKLKDALDVKNNEKLDAFWSNIKDELQKPEYAHLSKTPITVDGKDYNLEVLFTAAKDDTQYEKKGSELPPSEKDKLQELVDNTITAQKLKDALDVKNNENLNTLWSDIKDELQKPEYARLSKTPITVYEKDYNLEVLFTAAKDNTQYEQKGSELPNSEKNKLQELVNANIDGKNFKVALENTAMDLLWSEIKSELKKPNYAHLSKTFIKIDGTSYDLESLFAAAKDNTQYEKRGSELPAQAKSKLQDLVNVIITAQKLKDALTVADAKNNENLNNLWSGIKDELQKPEYAHLSKTPITVDGKDYNLKVLFAAAKDDTQYGKKGSELLAQAKSKLQELVDNTITAQKLKDALDVKNNENLNTLWSDIKDELQKPEYARLSKTLISIKQLDEEVYKDSLEPLFTAAKDNTQYEQKGFELPFQAKNKLQELVNANIDGKHFKVALENTAMDLLWSEIKSELKKPNYAHLSKTFIKIDGIYYLESLFAAAKDDTQYEKKGSELFFRAWYRLKYLVNSNIDAQKLNAALTAADAKNNEELDTFWTNIKDELQKPKYVNIAKTPIKDYRKDYKLEFLFAAAKDDTQYGKKGSELPAPAKNQLQELVKGNFGSEYFEIPLENVALDLLWSEIKSELKKYAHLSKTFIKIDGIYYLESLFAAAKDDTQYKKKGYELFFHAQFKLADLVNDIITTQKLKDALTAADVKNNENLNNLWSAIKDELQKPEYAYLAKTPITVGWTDYNLEPLFTAAKDDAQYRKEGSQLFDPAKNKLQSLVSADVQHPIFKSSLATANTQNNQKLDNFWTQLKKILNQPEFSKWKDTSIKIKNKSYDLEILFAAAKEKADVKGSALPLDAKLKLQELLNDQVTSEMIENQLLALNQAEAEKNKQTEAEKNNQAEAEKNKQAEAEKNKQTEAEKNKQTEAEKNKQTEAAKNKQTEAAKNKQTEAAKNKQAEAEKNKQAKEKQQSQGLNIGLATGGGVLFVAGVGGFLYWFFKIRK